ncbi:MAG: hypothetical protein AAF433_12160, partial [Bacteroidota bacterium]
MTEEQLKQLKESLQRETVKRMDFVLEQLDEQLPSGRSKHKQILLLRGRAERIRHLELTNTLGRTELDILYNQLTEDVLALISHLRVADFGQEPPPPPTYKEGHLLYQIPSKMQLQQRYQCQVRIAQQLDQLLKNLAVTEDLKTEQIPVAEVMEVEIIDPNAGSNPSFDILLVSDAEQHVDEYSYTEWLFLVRPLKTGAHDLFIKVSVIIKVDGRT